MCRRSNLYMILCMILPLFLFAGCKLVEIEEVPAYTLGRVTAVAFLAAEQSPVRREAVTAVWLLYSEAADALLAGDSPPAELKALAAEAIADKAQFMLASEIIDLFWHRLSERYSLGELPHQQVLVVLTEFRRGVADALRDYGE